MGPCSSLISFPSSYFIPHLTDKATEAQSRKCLSKSHGQSEDQRECQSSPIAALTAPWPHSLVWVKSHLVGLRRGTKGRWMAPDGFPSFLEPAACGFSGGMLKGHHTHLLASSWNNPISSTDPGEYLYGMLPREGDILMFILHLQGKGIVFLFQTALGVGGINIIVLQDQFWGGFSV